MTTTDAVLVSLFLGGISIAARVVLRSLKYSMTGAFNPLASPGGEFDKASRVPVIFLAGNDPNAAPPADRFEPHRGKSCEFHGKEYSTLVVFRLIHPEDRGFWSPQLSLTGLCFLLGCSDCVAETDRWKTFKWKRDNQSEHPPWASVALYPFLLRAQYFELHENPTRPY